MTILYSPGAELKNDNVHRVHEMQAFLTELISNFEFSTTDESKRIRREMCGVILPMIDGEKGAQMPLKVSLAARDC